MSSRRTNTTATARLKQDYMRMKRDPVPYITAEPLAANILEWHYVVKGPESSPFEGGYYHGKLIFPREFPFKPPSIYMTTPNGRFKCNTRLCLSISDFHPDTWNPAWSVSTILTGLLSFMLEKSPTLGSIQTSDYTKRQLACQSGPFNVKDRTFNELFPVISQEIHRCIQEREEELARSTQQAVTSPLTSVSSTSTAAIQVANRARPPGFLSGTVTNLVVIVSFAAFAYSVKFVLRGLID